jgi:hypothetical protein
MRWKFLDYKSFGTTSGFIALRCAEGSALRLVVPLARPRLQLVPNEQHSAIAWRKARSIHIVASATTPVCEHYLVLLWIQILPFCECGKADTTCLLGKRLTENSSWNWIREFRHIHKNNSTCNFQYIYPVIKNNTQYFLIDWTCWWIFKETKKVNN